jgi:myo-inositol-hexaphosphate 3-phosphohydrolase
MLSLGGSASAATATATANVASINQQTGLTTFAKNSGTTLADALADITASFTAATDSEGDIALFRVKNTGNFYLLVSDGVAGVTSDDVVIQLAGVSSFKTIDLTGGDFRIIT